MKFPAKLLFISLTIIFLFGLVLVPKAEAKKPTMPYASEWSCLNLETNLFELYIQNDPAYPDASKGRISTTERISGEPDYFVDWGNFAVGKTKVHYINYETLLSYVSSWDPITQTWRVQGWYTLNRQEHIDKAWICP